MSDKDKHAPAHKSADKVEAAKAAAAKADEARKDDHKPPGAAAPFKAKMSHEEEVTEGVKAAESHQDTTADIVKAEHAPFKAPAPPPLMAELVKLMDEVRDVSKAHKEEVLKLRDKFQQLQFKIPTDPNGPSMGSLHSAATKIEEGLNMLDPDCSARAPG
jgi:hypothetical protein